MADTANRAKDPLFASNLHFSMIILQTGVMKAKLVCYRGKDFGQTDPDPCQDKGLTGYGSFTMVEKDTWKV